MRRRTGLAQTPRSSTDAHSRKQKAAARELACTPVVDPYRGQLHDPQPQVAAVSDAGGPEQLVSGPVHGVAISPSDVRVSIPAGLAPGMLAPGYAVSPRSNTPRAAVWSGVVALILGALTALFGFVLLAGVALINTLGDTDRSFYRGTDASMVVIGLLDLALAAAGVLGGVALLSGRLSGRLWLTAFGWTTLGLSFYWMQDGRVATIIPCTIAATSAVVLLLAYHPGVTRWLGVQPPPQPE